MKTIPVGEHFALDDALEYKCAWLAIEQLTEVANIGFLSGDQFAPDEPDAAAPLKTEGGT